MFRFLAANIDQQRSGFLSACHFLPALCRRSLGAPPAGAAKSFAIVFRLVPSPSSFPFGLRLRGSKPKVNASPSAFRVNAAFP